MEPTDSISHRRLEPFLHQVAGQSLVFRYDATTICKSLIPRELRVYQTLPDVLKPHVPQYRGVIDIALHDPKADREEEKKEEEEEEEEKEVTPGQGGAKHPLTTQRLLDKVAKRQGQDNVYHFILLENIVSGYQRPCILDLKLGTRQHGDDAPSYKVHYQVNKCRSTTSARLGVRLCGMKVFQSAKGKYVKVDKAEGRHMRENDFREAMRHFLFNGRHIRRDLLPLLLLKLQRLEAAVSDLSSFRFYSSSLLVVYDGQDFKCKCKHGASPEMSSTILINGADKHTPGSHSCCGVHGKHSYDGCGGISIGEGRNRQADDQNLDLSLSLTDNGDTCNDLTNESPSPQTDQADPFHDSLGRKHCQPETQCLSSTGASGYPEKGTVVRSEEQVTLPQSSPSRNSDTDSLQKLNRDNLLNSDRDSPLSSDEDTVSDSAVPSSKATQNRSGMGEHQDEDEVMDEHVLNGQDSTQKKASTKSRVVAVCECSTRLVDVRMVDFAHTTHAGLREDSVAYQGPDQGCLLGLRTLINTFTDIFNDTACQEL